MVSWLSDFEMGIIEDSWEAVTACVAQSSIGRWKPNKV
jgi:hypothetical protein